MILAALTATVLAYQQLPMPTIPVAKISIADAGGVVRQLPTSAKATVLFFVAIDCPIANRMAPELARIVRAYRPKNISFLFVYVDPAHSGQQVQQHLREYKLGAPGIRDAKHSVIKAVGASVTPQAVVLDKTGLMLYRGRINDLFIEHGRSRKLPKTQDLRNALDQFLAGRPIKVPQTAALGCSIPPLS
ncbi:MAG: redoxin domain-containing protein [Chlorobia bacterium]|nr:redoxin domain-containing protein [Fimbriimonadaceae bacterium]